MSEETTAAHISKVRLKGYKSIIDTECTFKPGLNIIIGDNGSGKSNFLEFLEMANNYIGNLIIETELFWEIHSSFVDKSIIHKLESKIDIDRAILNNNSHQSIYKTEEIFLVNDEPNINYIFKPQASTIQFNLPDSFSEFSNSINYHYKYRYLVAEKENFYIYKNDKNKNIIINDILKKITFSKKELDSTLFIKSITESLLSLNDYLNRFSNISKIRINENFILKTDDVKKEVSITFLKFEFLINGKWLNWASLSDGTKRLFYIVGTISLNRTPIVFIEEPELGIHPNQLFKLMEFFTEQSSGGKQIIISTHSPKVLDHLEKDELDRIIIARHEGEAGTKMYHLEDSEIESLQDYEDGFISDYWVHIGFEKEEMEE